MAIKINDIEISESYMEFGVVLVPGTVLECESETEAWDLAPFGSGVEVVARTIYETAYATVSRPHA